MGGVFEGKVGRLGERVGLGCIRWMGLGWKRVYLLDADNADLKGFTQIRGWGVREIIITLKNLKKFCVNLCLSALSASKKLALVEG